MRNFLFCCGLSIFLFSCKNEKNDTEAASTDSTTAKHNIDLPYTASYSSSWSTEVSDADLKMVLTTYKDWADNNMSGLGKAMGDTVDIDIPSGAHYKKSNADLMKMWSTSRDSMSSVKINMSVWHKMYATDKKEGFIVTWYDETDTYKTGKVDSASYHDINHIKDGKIVGFEQYKRPKK